MSALAGGLLLTDIEDGVGLVTFNQPGRRNAVSVEMWEALAACLDAFAADEAVRVVVLTGAGSHAFVGGADLSALERVPGEGAARRAYDARTQRAHARLAAFPKPVIARIRGLCFGTGIDIALCCDLRIAGRDAEFAVPAARFGMAWSPGCVERLQALVGPGHARKLLLTGTRIDAAEAERIGLVNEAVAEETLSDRVMELAGAIVANAPLALAATKHAAVDALLPEVERDRAVVAAEAAACFDSDDYREGREALAAGREPRFRGR